MDRSDDSTPIPPALIGTGGTSPTDPPKKVTVAVPPVTVADDGELVSRITTLVNEVYTTTEAGLFDPNYRRTDNKEIRRFLLAGELALAWHDNQPTAESIVGCIRFFPVSPTTADFGVLACDPVHRGQRIGHRLVQFAEEQSRARGMTTMECQLLVATEFDHAFKVRLEEWYIRLGYRMVRTEEFSKDHFQLARHCITPAKLKVFEKSLGG